MRGALVIAACILLGTLVNCTTPGAIHPYLDGFVCDMSGDCDDDAACFASGGACYPDDGACWDEDR